MRLVGRLSDYEKRHDNFRGVFSSEKKNLHPFLPFYNQKNKTNQRNVKYGSLALLTKAMEFALPAFPNAPNMGLIITCTMHRPSEFKLSKWEIKQWFLVLQLSCLNYYVIHHVAGPIALNVLLLICEDIIWFVVVIREKCLCYRFRCGDTSIWIPHIGPSNNTTFDHNFWFCTKERRLPHDEISSFPRLPKWKWLQIFRSSEHDSMIF